MRRAELFDLWDERDRRYRLRKHSLPLDDVASIRGFRLREVDLLATDTDRQVALARLATWRPPLVEVI